ncbi:hypothetical protein LY78DRAFT_449166 [Colletotrichum sublineola]|nr:hypothetical protein LY78DRAFT_449166 [Colletotrichum sublineola]
MPLVRQSRMSLSNAQLRQDGQQNLVCFFGQDYPIPSGYFALWMILVCFIQCLFFSFIPSGWRDVDFTAVARPSPSPSLYRPYSIHSLPHHAHFFLTQNVSDKA